VVGLSPRRALVPAGIATALWYVFLIQAGLAVGRSLEAVKGLVNDVNHVLGLVALGAFALLGFWLWRRVRRRPEA